MATKFSFKMSWIDNEEKFLVKVLSDGETTQEEKFDGLLKAFEFIEDTMCGLQVAGEDWTFSY